MKKINIIIAITLCAIFGSCSNEENYFEDSTKGEAVPGTYYADLLLSTESSKSVNMITRGGPDEYGKFTDVYPYEYIYLHSADNLTKEEGHQVIEIPLKEVEFCDGCKGIHLKMTVLDNEEGYTVANEAGNKITLGNDDKVYFSTEPDTYWTPTIIADENSPVSGRDVFVQDDNNHEILRSANEYSKEDLIALLQEGEPHIDMERHCTAFKTFFMFTDVKNGEGGFYNITTSAWKEALGGEEYAPENFYIKLYIGPNFTDKYNVYSDNTDNADGGFYVTNQQQYMQFGVSENGNSGEIDTDGDGKLDTYIKFSYRGYGYQTQAGNYLISPLNTNIPVEEFSIYAFVKYTPDITQEPEDFLTSDEGAKWFEVQIPRMTLETNTVHWITLAFDINNLKVFTTEENVLAPSQTRAKESPEKIELKYPVKAICL